MKHCEHYESLVSAWLDDEVERSGQVRMIDHLARCGTCRDFYLDARALDGLLAVVRTPAGEEAPPREIWDRIEAETARAGVSRRFGLPAWALQAAAVLVIALGLGIMAWTGGVPRRTAPERIEIRLGEDRGRMTDERFVELATEVMRADRKYRTAMLEVMEQVESDASGGEGSADEIFPRVEEEEPSETTAAVRAPA